jgi:glucosamine-6-phosphate deaminase
MGGTMKKLQDQGHEIHVAYMTSGANGVFDYEAQKYLYFLKDFSTEYFWNLSKMQDSGKFIGEYNKILEDAERTFDENVEEERKTEFNMMIKKYIRNSEAKIAVSALGLKPSNVYSLELPFYGTHNKAKAAVGERDYEIVKSLLRLIEPTFIFAAGKNAIIQAI